MFHVTDKHMQTSLVLCLDGYILVHVSRFERGRIAYLQGNDLGGR